MKPYNLVIITPDQLRCDYLSCYSHPAIATKNLDALAQQGVKFDHMYCAAPLCAPSRISFATSTYFSDHNHRDYGSEISPDVPNLVTSLKRSGYRTGMFGKNHLFTTSRLPEVWDELDEICLGNYDGHPEYTHSFSAFTLQPEHPYNITDRLTDEGMAFVRENRATKKPFFLWLNYQDPHPAFCCPPPYDTLFRPEDITLSPAVHGYDAARQPQKNEVWRAHSQMDLCSDDDLKRAICHYMGKVRLVDDNVGRLMQCLQDEGLTSSTVILFFSDHGELLGDYGMVHKNPTFYECLSRIPAILVHPDGRWKDTTFSGLTEEVDLAPTLLELLQCPVPPTMVGTSWLSALNAKDDTGKQTALCEAGGACPTWQSPLPDMALRAPFAPTSFGPGAMLREGSFKLCLYGDDRCELYDLVQDPFELTNLYGSETYRAVQERMTTLLAKRLLTVKVRQTDSVAWDYPPYPTDVRFEPLEDGAH